MIKIKFLLLGIALMITFMGKAAAIEGDPMGGFRTVYLKVNNDCPEGLSLIKAGVDGKPWARGEVAESLARGRVFKLNVLSDEATHTFEFIIKGRGDDLGFPEMPNVTIDGIFTIPGVEEGKEVFYLLAPTGVVMPAVMFSPIAELPDEEKAGATELNMAD